MGFDWNWWQWILFFVGCLLGCIASSDSDQQ